MNLLFDYYYQLNKISHRLTYSKNSEHAETHQKHVYRNTDTKQN